MGGGSKFTINFSNIKIMLPNTPISEIMTINLVTVSPDSFVSKIMDLFNQNEFHHLPVVKPGNVLVGIISREDIQKVASLVALSTIEELWREPDTKALTAKDIMTKYPLTLDPDDTIGLAADIVLGNRFHAVPVVDDGQLVGLVTSHDLIAYAFDSPVGTEIKTV